MSGIYKYSSGPKVERAVVRYSYEADNDDELALKDGDIITILDKNLEDAGWWKGELNGMVGVFPDNFVELLPPEEPRPKKPPPPSSVTKQPPKLPDHGPAHDTSAQAHKTLAQRPLPQEPVHIDKKPAIKSSTDAENKRPSISSKKPSIPPPVGAKPGPKPALPTEHKPHNTPTPKEEPKPILTSSIKEEKKDKTKEKEDDHFDALEITTDKLTHPTASRAKGPSKRPPSQEDEKTSTQNGDIKELHKRPQPVKEIKEEHGPSRSHAPPTRPPDPSPGTASLLLAVEELKREMKELRAHTVSKAAYEELKMENEKLKHDLESLKSKQSKQYRELFNEIDEEKKLRVTTQIDMERIRKLVSESHV